MLHSVEKLAFILTTISPDLAALAFHPPLFKISVIGFLLLCEEILAISMKLPLDKTTLEVAAIFEIESSRS